MILELPLPPSVNRIWQMASGMGVYRTKEYIAWRKECDGLCMLYRWHKTPIVGRFIVEIVLNEKQPNRGDCDNRIKAILDFLHSTGITEDDRYCQKVSAEWGEAPAGCRVTITAADAGRVDPDG